MPAYETAGAAGFDLRSAEDLTLAAGARALVATGIAMALPTGHEGQVRPRSGLAVKHGVTVLNSPGTVDEDYRGEVKVPLINHGPIEFTVTPGMRIAQKLIKPVPRTTWVEVDELPPTARGAGGFGHTGV